VLFEVVVDGHLRIDEGVENTATDALLGDLGEEAFDRVAPGRRGPCEMHVEPGMVLRHLAVDLVQEADELLAPVLRHALAAASINRSSQQEFIGWSTFD
jgi:hypothetical protein